MSTFGQFSQYEAGQLTPVEVSYQMVGQLKNTSALLTYVQHV